MHTNIDLKWNLKLDLIPELGVILRCLKKKLSSCRRSLARKVTKAKKSKLKSIITPPESTTRTNYFSLYYPTRLLYLFNLLLYITLISSTKEQFATADDSGAAPQFDIGALASIASNIGSNPQIMGLVSSLFNQNASQKQTGSLSNSNGPNTTPLQPQQQALQLNAADAPLVSSSTDQDTSANPFVQDSLSNQASGNDSPLRRGLQNKQQLISVGAQQNDPSSKANAGAASSPPSNALSGIMSMLPSVLPNLNLGGLGSLLGQAGLSKTHSSSSTSPTSTSNPSSNFISISSQTSSPAVAAVASNGSPTTSAILPPSIPATMSQVTLPTNSAQSVINQVLTAYASGQIPNELIQLGLSGRVPSQIIELALSGQVPPQLIQMVITGQVPMSTINAFLATMQSSPTGSDQQQQQQSGGSRVRNSAPSAPSSSSAHSNNHSSATRSIFETLFGSLPLSSSSSNASITVPTLLGPLPIPRPSVRKIGKMVGGTITNVASMIPF